MDDKDRCDLLLKLAAFRMTRVTSRREHEWKVTVALWALLGAGIIYFPQRNPLGLLELALILLIVVLGHTFFWIGNHWLLSKEDILASFYCADRAHNLVLPPAEYYIHLLRGKDRPQDWPAHMSGTKKWFGFLCAARCQAQILTTATLSLGVWLACYNVLPDGRAILRVNQVPSLENAIQLAATAAPILLAGMGLVLSLRPPSRPSGKWIWFGSFVVIGIVAAFTEWFDRNIREKEIIAQITGGDSFCHVDVTFTARNAITFMLRHSDSGTYTIPDVTVQLQDSADVAKLVEEAKSGNTTLSDDAVAIIKRSTKTVCQGTVSPNSFALLSTVPYTGERRSFLVFIAARNGLYRQPITVTRGSDGKDVVDNHLFKTEGNKDVEIWHQ